MESVENIDIHTQCWDMLFDLTSAKHNSDVSNTNHGNGVNNTPKDCSDENETNSICNINGADDHFSENPSSLKIMHECCLSNDLSEEENEFKTHQEPDQKTSEDNVCAYNNLQSNSNDVDNSRIISIDNDDNNNNSCSSNDIRRFECNVCGELFRHKSNLHIHSSIHKSKEFCEYATTVRRFYCPICNLSFATDGERKFHLIRHREKEIQSNEMELNGSVLDNTGSDIISSQQVYKVNKPNKVVTYQNKLVKVLNDNIHDVRFFNKENRFLCLVCFKKFMEYSDFIDHLRVHTVPDAFLCKTCDLGFITLLDKQHHINQRHGKDSERKDDCEANAATISKTFKDCEKQSNLIVPNSCHLCNKVFLAMDFLAHHLKNDHSDNEKRHICVECKQCFFTASDLAAHQERHARDVIHVCNFCGKGYKDSRSFKSHVNIHTREKLFKCPYCSWQFTDRGNLSSHVRAKHTLEYKYKCTICGKACLTPYLLKQHTNTHTKAFRYNCHLCSNSYPSRCQLSRHLAYDHFSKRTKSNCTDCGKQYYSDQMRKHMLDSHSGKSFQCNLCGNSYKRRWSLKMHQKSHKNDDPKHVIQWRASTTSNQHS